MTKKSTRKEANWREFELLVAKIESVVVPQGAIVKSPDRVRDYYSKNKRGRDVDASIRYKVGTVEILITIECRSRSRSQDETWIEQLATKKTSIRASQTVAVSSRGFSEAAHEKAKLFDIELRTISEITSEDVAGWIDINCIFTSQKKMEFIGFYPVLRCLDASGIEFADEVKREQQEQNVDAKFLRFGSDMMSVADFIRMWQYRFGGTEKDLFFDVELDSSPVLKQIVFQFENEGLLVKTNRGELPLESFRIEVEVAEQTVRVPPARMYRYADEMGQLAQGVDFVFPDSMPIIVTIIKYESGEFKMQMRQDADRFNGEEFTVIQSPESC